jgi:hypothetical protein
MPFFVLVVFSRDLTGLIDRIDYDYDLPITRFYSLHSLLHTNIFHRWERDILHTVLYSCL